VTPTHHLAFRLSEAVPICGSGDGGGLSLEADKVTCEQCRRICELGPLPELPEFVRLDEFTECEWFAACTFGTIMAMQHSVLGYVPLCGRCAGVIGVELP